LGRHRKPTRIQLASRLPAATPAAVGLAAACCISSQAYASTSAAGAASVPADATAGHLAAYSAVGGFEPGPRYAELLSVTWTHVGAGRHARPVALTASIKSAQQAVWYTVQPGDSLSSIAGHYYQDEAAWPTIYWANQSQLPDANLIQPGQRLRIPAKPAHIPGAPALPAASTAPAAPAASSAQSAPAASATVDVSTSASSAGSTDTSALTGDESSFQQCVIARESGGDPQIMNSTGHYGLYQFSYSTWVAYGGSPADFGDASVAEQNQVFDNAIAAGGEGNWAPYDGC
jgi:LysM repeat protein